MSVYDYKGNEINQRAIIKSDIAPNNNIKKFFTLISDDVTSQALQIADKLVENEIFPVFALKMESMNKEITWDDLRKLQNDYGFEICFHGMDHSHYPAGSNPTKDDIMMHDIREFLELTKSNDINIYGYAGPNHYGMPADARNMFLWARTAYGSDLKVYGADRQDKIFSNVQVWSCEITNATTAETTKQSMIAGLDWIKGDSGYLTPMCHTQNLVAYIDKYIEIFNIYKEQGVVSLTGIDAVKQTAYASGQIGNNNLFEIQAGIATNPYHIIGANGKVYSHD